jgi:DMSO/TMAO reductase YedYZ molybdopterin-dependent catalytic subunit
MSDESEAMNGSRTITLFGITALLMLLTVGCVRSAGSGGGSLAAVEVREYKGEKLGLIADFQENSIKGPQTVDRTSYRLKVDGLVGKPASYRYGDVLSKETTYTKVVTLHCVEGWSVKALWEGVLLSDLIDRTGPHSDAVTVVLHAADEYTTSLPLDYIRSQKILLAYKLNGVELPAANGFPFQVVAQDRWGYKWCRWVTRIELSNDPKYKGYWEQRGYSQRGLQKNAPFAP